MFSSIAFSSDEACLGYFGMRDIGIFGILFKGYGILRIFGIQDTETYFGILKLSILGYTIFWDMRYCLPIITSLIDGKNRKWPVRNFGLEENCFSSDDSQDNT